MTTNTPENAPSAIRLTDDDNAMGTLTRMWGEAKSVSEIAREIHYPLRVVRLTIDLLIEEGTLKPQVRDFKSQLFSALTDKQLVR